MAQWVPSHLHIINVGLKRRTVTIAQNSWTIHLFAGLFAGLHAVVKELGCCVGKPSVQAQHASRGVLLCARKTAPLTQTGSQVSGLGRALYRAPISMPQKAAKK